MRRFNFITFGEKNAHTTPSCSPFPTYSFKKIGWRIRVSQKSIIDQYFLQKMILEWVHINNKQTSQWINNQINSTVFFTFGVGSGLQRVAKAVEFLVKMLSIQQMTVTNKRKIELQPSNLQVKLNKLLLDTMGESCQNEPTFPDQLTWWARLSPSL